MRSLRALLAVAFLVAPVWVLSQASDPPDPDQEFPGQRLSCDNYHDNAHKCQCALATSCDAHRQKNPDLNGDGDSEMGSRCRTYCKRDHCHCLSPCTS